MLEITSHRHGEILNYKHGKETAQSLTIPLRGLASPQSQVSVNGIPAQRNDREFFLELPLTEKINTVTVRAKDKFGERTLSIVLQNKLSNHTIKGEILCIWYQMFC